MNKSWINDLWIKAFRSGRPLNFYIGINILLFLIIAFAAVPLYLSGNEAFSVKGIVNEYFAFPADVSRLPERFYTLLTYQFFHQGIFHLIFNMLTLYWLDTIFSDFLKPRQFHFVYLGGGIAGALFYLAALNIFPVFQETERYSIIIGSSAAVMGIAGAAATLVPDFTLRLLLFGSVKLKYLLLALVVIDIIFITSTNPGGSFAHIGGVIFGFTYIKLLQNGTDLSSWIKKRSKLRVVKNSDPSPRQQDPVNQPKIDAILDKISRSGYDKLSSEEKSILFRASKK